MRSFRLYHALFAISVGTAYVTAEELGLVHAWTGYLVAALLAARLLSGFAGVRGFEFRRLLPRSGRPPLNQGGLRHPAIGHALTLALFVSVLGTAGTGIAMDQGGTLVGKSIRADDGDGEDHDDDGGDFSLGLIAAAHAEDNDADDKDQEEGPLGEVHETLGNLLLPLALIHAVWLLLFRLDMARFALFLPRRR